MTLNEDTVCIFFDAFHEASKHSNSIQLTLISMLAGLNNAGIGHTEVQQALDTWSRAPKERFDTTTLMLDITAPTKVDIEARHDGKVIWVNVDGLCRLRISRISNLTIKDNRPNSDNEPS